MQIHFPSTCRLQLTRNIMIQNEGRFHFIAAWHGHKCKDKQRINGCDCSQCCTHWYSKWTRKREESQREAAGCLLKAAATQHGVSEFWSAACGWLQCSAWPLWSMQHCNSTELHVSCLWLVKALRDHSIGSQCIYTLPLWASIVATWMDGYATRSELDWFRYCSYLNISWYCPSANMRCI